MEPQRGDVLAEFDRFCGRIKHAVAGVAWFVWSSRDPAFADMRLGMLMSDKAQIARFQSIIDRHAAPTGLTIHPPSTEEHPVAPHTSCELGPERLATDHQPKE
jgi:hypothetical protein